MTIAKCKNKIRDADLDEMNDDYSEIDKFNRQQLH